MALTSLTSLNSLNSTFAKVENKRIILYEMDRYNLSRLLVGRGIFYR